MIDVVDAVDVSIAFGDTCALAGVSVQVRAQEVVALTGQSGSGKSTLLQVMAGIIIADDGRVAFQGADLASLTDRARSGVRLRNMGFVFQSSDMVPDLTLLENVALPMELRGVGGPQARDVALGRLATLGIDSRTAGRPAGAVSGGQAQRAAVARALVNSPSVIFADEPTGALDSANGTLVMDALLAAREEGAAIVLVTHDAGIAARADRVVHLRDGRVIA